MPVLRFLSRQVRMRIDARSDRGAVGVLVAMMLTPVLLGSAAIGIDVANWYWQGAKLQAAADAAALAGVVYMPADMPKATAEAKEVAAQNGYTDANSTLTTGVGRVSSQLRVTITSTANNSFGDLLGKSQEQLTRTAVADYVGPAPMGSPCNIMGNEQMELTGTATRFASANCDSSSGSFWLGIAGHNVNKIQGDAYQAAWCTRPQSPVTTIDGCSSMSPTTHGNNSQYDANGYIYTIRVTQAGTLTLQGYDMSYAPTGLNCEDLVNAYSITSNDSYTSNTEPARRYRSPSSTYDTQNSTSAQLTQAQLACAGDAQYSTTVGTTGPQGDGTVTQTTVTVRDPSPDAQNPLLGTVRCTRTYGGYPIAGSNDPTSTTADSWRNRLKSTSNTYNELQETFHRWNSLTTGTGCPGATMNVTPGDYSVQVKTGSNGGGSNMYALRARLTSTAASTNVSIFANSREALYNNIPASATTTFHLVRLDTRDAGHTLVLSFFDLGDANSGSFTINVMQPDNSNLSSSQRFAACTFNGVSNNATPGTCQLANATSSQYGGRWQNIYVQVPANYTCNLPNDQSKCWVRIQMVNNTVNAHDLTTWTAGISGVPIRLVE